MVLSVCCIQIFIKFRVAIAVVISANRKSDIGVSPKSLNCRKVIQAVHIGIISGQFQLCISFKKGKVAGPLCFCRNQL